MFLLFVVLIQPRYPMAVRLRSMILVESSKATTRSDVRFYVSSSILKKTLLPSVRF